MRSLLLQPTDSHPHEKRTNASVVSIKNIRNFEVHFICNWKRSVPHALWYFWYCLLVPKWVPWVLKILEYLACLHTKNDLWPELKRQITDMWDIFPAVQKGANTHSVSLMDSESLDSQGLCTTHALSTLIFQFQGFSYWKYVACCWCSCSNRSTKLLFGPVILLPFFNA